MARLGVGGLPGLLSEAWMTAAAGLAGGGGGAGGGAAAAGAMAEVVGRVEDCVVRCVVTKTLPPPRCPCPAVGVRPWAQTL